MRSTIWRAAVSLADWERSRRILSRQDRVDVVFISNLRDDVDRQRYMGKRRPKLGHVAAIRVNIKGVIGRLRFIDVDSNELLSSSGRKKAKEQFISAVRWGEDRGAKVVLLAASTKRLFGRDGDEIVKMFPNIIFTIGDNGTACLLIEEVFSALQLAQLNRETARIAILGPYGILGQAVVNAVNEKGYNIIGVGTNLPKLQELVETYGINVASNFDDLYDIDLVVACTHSKQTLLTSEIIQKIKRPTKKIIVIDVAEPSNFVLEEYQLCQEWAIRQDAGNGYSKHLKYVLGSMSYQMLRLTDGVVFGCFAEALSIGYSLKNGDCIQANWFKVNAHNIELAKNMFEKTEFGVPEPRCFGEMIDSFKP
jgi:predicted amino acid dehydrogenase